MTQSAPDLSGASPSPPTTELAWLAVEGARQYRLAERDLATGKTRSIYYGQEPRFSVPGPQAQPSGAYRVEVLVDGADDYVTLVPFMTLQASPRNAIALQAPEVEGDAVAAWRLVLRDDTRDEIVLDRVSTGPRFAVERAALSPSHRFRYRFYRWVWTEKRWQEVGDYRELPPSTLRPFAAEKKAPAENRRPRLVALITIDTEASLRMMRHPSFEHAVDHQVFGKVEGRELGIRFIMDQLEARGFRGTFFVDMLMEYQFGQSALERTVEAIAGRGHAIELHMHPSPGLIYTGNEDLAELARNSNEPDGFRRCLDLAMELFLARVGRPPIAFRNGSYRIFDSYFDILRSAGFRYDSSVFAFKNCHASPWIRGRTQPFEVVPGLWEMPVSWIVSRPEADDDPAVVAQFTTKQGSTRMALEQSLERLAKSRAARPLFVIGMLHSYSYLGEFRGHDETVAAEWNERHDRVAGPALHGKMHRGLGSECVFLEGAYEARIESIDGQLDILATLPEAEAVAFDTLAERHREWLSAESPAVEPVGEFDRGARQTRLAAVRRYSHDYLSHLEATGRACPAPEAAV
ncbi:MAG: hypothetical protein JO267_01010 [Alphaproteobacteria bacterium]|nr:hypothetical protein [Alphaproteobacteria bacterium]